QKLLSDAGYPDGKGIALTVKVTPQLPSTATRATLMQQALKSIGVDLQIEQLQLAAWIQAYQTVDFELLNTGTSFSPDPDGYLYPYYDSRGSLNAGSLQDPNHDRLIEQA